MRRLETKWAIGVVIAAFLIAFGGSLVYASGPYTSCARSLVSGGWNCYSGQCCCGSFCLMYGSNGADRCRWYTGGCIASRDMYLTYRHAFTRRSSSDTSADHWANVEGGYSGDATINQQGSGDAEVTVGAFASYNWDDWLECGSDGGPATGTIVNQGRFYPEFDAVYAGKGIESYMYAGNVYQWRYLMSNPAQAYGTWGSPIRFAHTGGVTEGPGWYQGGRVNNGPGTGPGGTMDLYFNMRPTTTGDYNEDFQMVYEGVSWFGDKVASNGNMRTWTRLSRKAPGATDGWDSGAKKKGETVRFYIAGADSWGAGNAYSWDWDASTTQGWYAGNACAFNLEDSNDRVRIDITGADPYCYSSGGLAINADYCKYMTVRMWSNGGTTAQLFWSSSAGGWDGARSVDFNIIADSQWHVYRVALPASWSGTVYQLRFDPIGAGAANGQTVYVDWLRIHHVSDGMTANAWLGTVDNTWSIYNSSAMSWDSSANAWYKDYTITGNYPTTYYCAMHVYNDVSQLNDNTADRKYGDNYRTYSMANTAPTVSNANYSGDGWTADNTPTLQWTYADADSNAQTNYQVQVDDNSDFSSPAVDTGDVSSSVNTYTPSALADGRWYWRVKVKDGYDWSSSWSTGTSFRVDATPPTTPTITSVAVNELDATVYFSGSTDANSLHYEIKLDGGSYATATSPKAYTNLSGGSHTVYVKAIDSLGNESGVASRGFTIDSIPPTVTNITVTPQFVGATGAYLQGYLYVDANVADTGGSNLASVQTSRDGGATLDTMPAKNGDPEHNYEKVYTIDETWANGANSIIIKATDGAVNVTTTSPVSFNVNKNEIEVTIGLQGWDATGEVSRAVAFTLNGTTVLDPVSVQFMPPGNSTVYRLRDFTDATGTSIASLSAKTAWTLRKKVSVVSLGYGQYTANMTGSSPLAGGDLNGDNVVNALDYSVLRSAWGQFSLGDINGDGWTNNADYLILKGNWYKKGDAQ